MNVRSFLDTNVLIYADDSRSPGKQNRAIDLILEHQKSRTAVVSLQVLQEYFITATGKLKLDRVSARRKVELFSQFHVVVLDVPDVLAAIDLHRLHQISFWDALIIRAAKQAGCRVLLTEDMQFGREIEGLRIVNPFAPGRD